MWSLSTHKSKNLCDGFEFVYIARCFSILFLPAAQRHGQVVLKFFHFQSLSFFVTFDLFNLRCRILQTDFTSSRYIWTFCHFLEILQVFSQTFLEFSLFENFARFSAILFLSFTASIPTPATGSL